MISFDRFIYAQGINDVGLATSKSLSENFSSLEELINTGIEELLMIRDIGPIVANSILDFFKDIKNLDNIDRLIEKGVEIIYQSENDSQILSGKTFVITGTLKNMTRSRSQKLY